MVFYSKLLLFGEYTIMLNSKGLTVPLRLYKGELRIPHSAENNTEKKIQSNRNLSGFLEYLSSHRNDPLFPDLDMDLFREELRDGLYFDSTILSGYGIGSSGALVAAVYKRYAIPESHPQNIQPCAGTLRKYFQAMESFFHGTSSGIDPLSCFFQTPLLIQGDEIQKITLPLTTTPSSGMIFLIDTGIIGDTKPLVKIFNEKRKTKYFQRQLSEKIIPASDVAVDSLIQGDFSGFYKSLGLLSALQLPHFREMIPNSFIKIWESGISTGDYYLKLCGSGGGGFLLGFSTGKQRAVEKLRMAGMKIIPVLYHRDKVD